MPVTMRVVQMLPGPMPTFTESTPASASARAPARVATLPPISDTAGILLFDPADAIEHALRMAVGGIDHQYVDTGFDERRNAIVSVGTGTDACADA